MTRRELLSLLLVASLEIAGVHGCNRRVSERQLLAWLRERFPEAAKAASIGKAYLEAFPDEGKLDILYEALRRAALGRAENAAEYRDAFDAGVRADFEVDELVQLRGWLLSRLEARACARLVLAARAGE